MLPSDMRIALLAILVCGSLSAAAQFNFPFPTRNSVWTQYSDHWSTTGWPEYLGRNYTSYYMMESDSAIDGRVYAQIYDHTGTYIAAVRDTAGKVMVVPDGMQNEFLLYDFTIPEGVDTTLEVWLLQHQEVYAVSMHGLGPTGDDGRIVIESNDGYYRWIEGVGCTAGLFMEPWINVSGYWLELQCMSVGDMKYYPITTSGTCEITTTVLGRSPLEMLVYPNPATDQLTVELGSAGLSLPFTINTMDGRVVQQGSTQGSVSRISTAALAEGLYAITINDAGQLFRTTFLKADQ